MQQMGYDMMKWENTIWISRSALQIDLAFITYVWILGARKPAFSQKVLRREKVCLSGEQEEKGHGFQPQGCAA